jgi:hypothetical protein
VLLPSKSNLHNATFVILFLSMSSGFDIPLDQAPEDPRALAAMINFLNDVNSSFDFSATERLWEERGLPADILSNFVSFAQTTADYTRDNGVESVINLTKLYDHWDYSSLVENPDLTKEMIETFNRSFWNERPERLVAVHNLGKNAITILGGVPPIRTEDQ